jgi:PPM family protein phosphatase
MAAANMRRVQIRRESRSRRPALAPIEVAAMSDRGQVREINEDAVHFESPTSLEAQTRGVVCALADGMGGYAAGDVASRLAVETIRDQYYANPSAYIVEALCEAVEAANQDIWQHAQHSPENSGMGCTLTASIIMDGDLVVGHVGDSRAYLVRGQGITQITEDHSWVAEQVARGSLTLEQANQHPRRNVILRALGAAPSVDAALYQERVRRGDVVVLCSDGLSTVVSDEEIGRMVRDCPPAQAVRRLVDLANKRGAPDNVTVAVLRLGDPARTWTARLRRWGPLLAVAGASLGLGLSSGLYAWWMQRVDDQATESSVPRSAPSATPHAIVVATATAVPPSPATHHDAFAQPDAEGALPEQSPIESPGDMSTGSD